MRKLFLWIMVLLFAVLMSFPWLLPHCGAFALVGFIPLLIADAFASELRIKHFMLYVFTAFVLWNTTTTFWVCNATIGGAIFAILFNSSAMSIIWALFRSCKKRFSGVLPYVFLASTWVAWERLYMSIDISWPWLNLGNAFAQSTGLIQWYEYTGSLGGSLWVWLSNLSLFALFVACVDNYWKKWNLAASISAIISVPLVVFGPIAFSKYIYNHYEELSEGSLEVLIAQPNIDPYNKFGGMSQAAQTQTLLSLYSSVKDLPPGTLYLAPETFCSDIILNIKEQNTMPQSSIDDSPTVRAIRNFLSNKEGDQILLGASTYDITNSNASPSLLARPYGVGWIESHNSALLLDAKDKSEVFHKSKLVVGTELTPYPRIFVPLDDWLSDKLGVNGLIGRCVGQDEISVLNYSDSLALGCAICYESVYGEYCTGYVKKGAQAITVITNDAWWGDTPGYKQHFSYSRLRAIELRRDIARCANTGISAFIDQRGDIVSQTSWWEATTLRGKVNLNSSQTFFVRYGDICGRICTFVCLLLFLAFFVKLLLKSPRN